MATIVSYSGKDLKRMSDAVELASSEIIKQYNVIKDTNTATGIGGTAGELMAATLTETDTTMEELTKTVDRFYEELKEKKGNEDEVYQKVEDIYNR